jgi:hypothetical protein
VRLRYRHAELTEIELDGAFRLPAELGAALTPRVHVDGVLELLGRAVLFVVRLVVFSLGLTARIVLPILGEIVCVALAALCCTAGLVGRGLSHAGRAAAHRSWLIAAGRDALAKLPPPSRVERDHRTAIAVRVVR